MRLFELGCLKRVTELKPVLCIIRKKLQEICIKSPNSRPAVAVPWQSVFGFLYWGAPLDKPRHNRSSSPFTTLADIVEHKVASTGAGQPNYWPKTWFGANAYNAKFGVPNYTYRKCSDFCCHSVRCYKTPGKHKNVPKCTGATWWGYPQGNWEIEKRERKQKRCKGKNLFSL